MAQSVEQLIRNQQVRGSNPLISSISSRTFTVRDDFLCGNFLPRFRALKYYASLPGLYVFRADRFCMFHPRIPENKLIFPYIPAPFVSYNQIFTPRFRALKISRSPAWLIRFPLSAVFACFTFAFRKTNLSFPICRHLLSSYNQILTPRFRALKISRSPARLIRFPLSAVSACFILAFRKTNLSFPIYRLLSSHITKYLPRASALSKFHAPPHGSYVFRFRPFLHVSRSHSGKQIYLSLYAGTFCLHITKYLPRASAPLNYASIPAASSRPTL